jgi:hypothetical protein
MSNIKLSHLPTILDVRGNNVFNSNDFLELSLSGIPNSSYSVSNSGSFSSGGWGSCKITISEFLDGISTLLTGYFSSFQVLSSGLDLTYQGASGEEYITFLSENEHIQIDLSSSTEEEFIKFIPIYNWS